MHLQGGGAMAEHDFARILLMVEGTDAGMAAARSAIGLSANQGAELMMMAVVDTRTLKQLLSNRIFVEEEMEEYEEEMHTSARRQMDYVTQLATEAQVDYRTDLVKGACHTCVLEKLRDNSSDLLIMGAFRATQVKTDLMAREKQLILDETPCPVMLVPAPGD